MSSQGKSAKPGKAAKSATAKPAAAKTEPKPAAAKSATAAAPAQPKAAKSKPAADPSTTTSSTGQPSDAPKQKTARAPGNTTGSTAPKKKKAVKSVNERFTIDCSEPAADEIFDIASFEKFLQDRIKVGGKVGVLGDVVSVARDGNTVAVSSKTHYSKRYFKYLTKKFLKKQMLRDYIRVISKGKQGYFLRYFNFNQGGEEEEAE